MKRKFSYFLVILISITVTGFAGGPPAPDLDVQSFTSSSCVYVVGEPLTFTCNVKNLGLTFTQQWKLRIKAGDDVLKTVTLNPLAFNESITRKGNWTPTAPGTYQILCRADLGDLVSEFNETNNVKTFNITVRPKKPDLTVDLLASSPPTVEIGKNAMFTCVVKNVGYAFTNNYKIRLKLGDEILATETRSGLPKDGISKVFFTYTASGAIGKRQLLCRADLGDQIDEYSETNNHKTIDVTIMPKRLILTPQIKKIAPEKEKAKELL